MFSITFSRFDLSRIFKNSFISSVETGSSPFGVKVSALSGGSLIGKSLRKVRLSLSGILIPKILNKNFDKS